jgi:hypothetical protein
VRHWLLRRWNVRVDVLYRNGGFWSGPLAVDGAQITAVSCASSTFCVVADFPGPARVLDPTAA